MFQRILNSRAIIRIFLIVSFVLHIVFFVNTNYNELPNDVVEHTNYIKFVAQNKVLPNPRDCWVCYHPPPYYLTTAGISLGLNSLGITDYAQVFRIIQFLSIIQYFCLLTVGIKIFEKIFSKNSQLIFASALWIFWPSSYIHANRLGNDTSAFLFMALAFYFLLNWWKSGKTKDLLISLIATSIGLLIKSNAALMLPVIIISVGYKLISNKQLTKEIFLHYLLLLIIPILAFTFNQRHTFQKNDLDDRFVGNIGPLLGSIYRVENTPQHLFGFDIISFVSYANINPDTDQGGRQFFWNYLFKTALFTEEKTHSERQYSAAIILSYLSLIVAIFFVWRVTRLFSSKEEYNFPLVLQIVIFVSAVLYFRYKFSIANINDFRYIYPALIPLIALYVQMTDILEHKRLFKIIYYIISFFFVSISSLYFIL